ncbi:O-methyltransferase [Amycolatopsis sp. FDAARGOS 1241]|uniref:O-methyltransferase n=1 Tax=Amycolatopsis sp. FDAARGOS 1241 TaxID=2778070 RepID=UPI00194EE5A7|nr:O-methyltransferase [Amycolatopsis sp. FDAARGOS 1241]QRP44452.1 O-methyltransferase [Amycolatopsis sp. FDAARGOS 1241]
MNRELWTAVDDYLGDALLPADPVLDAALADSAAAGLPPIAVSPTQGRLLNLLARTAGARSILELGTLAGYSTIWLARALPTGGRIVTCEYDPKHAAVARKNLDRAGFGPDVAEILVGAALDTLPGLRDPFDFIFIDADKANLAAYVEHSLRLSHPGTTIVVDNVVRDGEVINADNSDPAVQGVRTMLTAIHTDARLDATAIQTVGDKGYDGFLLARVH